MTTKILALTDALGNLVRFALLPGHRFDTVGVPPLIEGVEFEALIADKAFDSDAVIADLDARGAKAVISQHPRRSRPLAIDQRGDMGQVLHGSARTTEAVRRTIQHSQESIRTLAGRYGINPKTVAKWKRRCSTADAPMGPKAPRSTVLSQEEEAIVVAFRKHTLLPLDDCLYALQATIPHLTRSSLHRCLQRHGISRLPDMEGEKASKKKFKPYPIGFFHIDIAEVRTEEGKLYLFVAIDRTSKIAFAKLLEKADYAGYAST